MYQVFIAKQVVKEARKRGKLFKRNIGKILEDLATNPYPRPAEKLTGVFDFIYSYHFSYQETSFRLAYTVDEEKKQLAVILLGPRENFYQTLRQKLG